MSFRRHEMKLATIILLVCELASAGADLTWGLNGGGGAGTWDATTANWWDGSQNAVWQQSGNAVFSGSGATVTASTFVVTASSMTFNSPGYTLSGGWIYSGSNGLTITTNADATISTTLSSNGLNGNLLIKTGTATLSMAGTNFLGTVQVNQGEYRVIGSSDLFFSNVTLADAPGVILTFGQGSTFTSIKSLSGGGSHGGIVQPDNQARTTTLSIYNSGTFGGIVQDNGGGQLALKMIAGNNFSLSGSGTTGILFGTPTGLGTQSLTNANTYSGATTVDVGILSFSGSGSALNSALTVSNLGAIILDNSGTAKTNRISDTAAITMQSGSLSMVGNALSFVNETAGMLRFAGAVLVNVQRSGTNVALAVSGVTRIGHATLNFTGDGQLLGTGLANDSTGIAPIYVRAGNDWASMDANGSLSPFKAYVTDPNAANASSNVKLTSPFAISGTSTWTSLNLQNNSGATTTMLNNGVLNIVSGGILSTGSADTLISTNFTTSAPEMVIANDNALTIAGQIQASAPGAALTKTGTGTLTLAFTSNSYSGTTSIDQGTLVVSNSLALGTGTTIEFGGGTLKAAGNFTLSQNLTRSTSYVETIDTGGFNVTVTGSTSALSKSGTGTLLLTKPAVGSLSVSQGTLQLANSSSGNATIDGGTLIVPGTLSSVTLNSGTLVASGTLSSLAFSGTTGILDLGGTSAATLNAAISSSSLFSSSRLTINFGIGSSGSDLWKLSSPPFFFSIATGTFRFEFQNLGGATTGTNYTLMTFPTSFPPPSTSIFAFAPDMAAAGWSGTFLTSGTDVRVSFTSVGVPEPDAWGLFSVGVIAWGACTRRKR